MGVTAQKPQKNISIKPANKPTKNITSPIKFNKQITKQQPSPITPLASDNAVANHSTSAPLSTTQNDPIANELISNIDNNHTVFNYPPASTTSNKTHNTNIPQHNKSDTTFATITANDKTPSRDQAIVFNSIDGIPQKDYVLAIGKIVSPKNITFVSRISNNRFCIFLSSKQILDNLIDTHPFITINNQELQIRRLNNPAKRIVISNVCPSINNQTILDHLKMINITPVSQISHLKAGIFAEGYDHILSFRRQMYIKYDDTPKIPSSLLISANDSQFRIFFTDDKITCFICKSTGHTSSTCKKSIMILTQFGTTKPNPQLTNDRPHQQQPPQPPPAQYIQLHKSHPSQYKKINIKKIKTSEQTTASENTPTNQKSSFTQPELTNKPENRSRSNSRKRFSEDLDTHLDPISHIFEEHNHTNLSFSQFKHIIEIIATLDHPIDTIHEYETTGNDIMELLEKIRPSLQTSKAKNNITRITSKLFKALENEAIREASATDSDTY
ncbi:hypothetical protein AGLY_012199 [Aphis glycines]|uniref:CCHC-type domain-containing protein n=1 Tax=Aphis glycines TaxID=307491 RepID=A0A6G0TBL0_APHGL|nr:hypothetical protein AGLY_012199 [Aphis glycines]